MVFGVVAANAADIEQREILSGAIRTAQSMNIDIAVISNIYNPIETDVVLKAEKRYTTSFYRTSSTVSFSSPRLS